ncbi:MAG: type II secretion system F family protein [Candidatus Portnoybacteria bacterium]|nr:type II secretion system F family protein [Candidatus Portnoybacteria bacterium]
MPNYIYTAKDKQGKTQNRHIETVNKHELAAILRSQELVLISAEVAGHEESGAKIIIFFKNLSKKWGWVSLVDKMIFSRHLAVMIDAGLSLNQALKILSEQNKNPKFKKIINQVETNVREGKSFSDSLAKYPKIFNGIYINMVKVGETSGNLNEVLKILAQQIKKDHELISRVRGAMIYPSVIIIAMFGIGILMMIMVVPTLTEIFIEMKIELPLSTRMIIGISNLLKNNSILGIVIFLIFLILMRFIIKINKIRKILHRVYLYIPILGSLIQKINSARFSRTISSLIESGVSLVESLNIVAGILNNIHFKEALINSAKEVQKGKELSKALDNYKNLYTPMVVQMIGVGEETGNLSEVLETLADFYEEEIDNTTKNLSSVIEPVIMLVIGVAVGFFAVSMIQPMYSMMGGI